MQVNLVLLIVFGICWGLTVPLTKIAVSGDHHYLGILFWQMFVAAVILGGILALQKRTIRRDFKALLYYFIVAVVGTLVPNSFSLVATANLPAGVMAIVLATVPLMSLLVALLARLEPFSWTRSLGIVIGVLALVILAAPGSSLPDSRMAPWLIVALVAPVCYAIEGNFVAAKSPRGVKPMETLFGASLLGVVLLLPMVALTPVGVSVWEPWDITRWAILGSSLGHVVAYTGYLWLLQRAGAVFTSQVAYVVTLTGIVGAILLLGERYGLMTGLAVLLMLLGVTLVKPKPSRA